MLVFRLLYRITQSSDTRTAELSQCQWWITNRQWEWIPECWTRNSKTHLWPYLVVLERGTARQCNGKLETRKTLGSPLPLPSPLSFLPLFSSLPFPLVLPPFHSFGSRPLKFSYRSGSADWWISAL